MSFGDNFSDGGGYTGMSVYGADNFDTNSLQSGVYGDNMGISQDALAKYWNTTDAQAFNSDGSNSWDSGGPQMAANSKWTPDGKGYVTKLGDGYGYTPKLDHGWNAAVIQAFSMLFPAIAGISSWAGAGYGMASTAGTEGASTAGSAASGSSNLGYSAADFDAAYNAGGFTPSTANNPYISGGGFGGGNAGASWYGGNGNQTNEQRNFFASGANAIQPGAGAVYSAGDKAMSDGNGMFGTNMTADDLFKGLGSLYGMSQANKQLGPIQNNLASMYGQNSPYADAMRKQLERRDAAAGRRSQYGPREVELQAKLAGQYSQNVPNLMAVNNQMNQAKMGNLMNLFALGQKTGAFSAAGDFLKKLYGEGGGSVEAPAEFGQGYNFGEMSPQYGNEFNNAFGSQNGFDQYNPYAGFDFGSYTNNPFGG